MTKVPDDFLLFLKCASDAALLVDVPVAFHLLPFLEQAGGGDDEHGVDADDAEEGREDVVDEGVAEARQRRGAARHQGRRGRAGAGRVREEGRRGAVQVAAALELD